MVTGCVLILVVGLGCLFQCLREVLVDEGWIRGDSLFFCFYPILLLCGCCSILSSVLRDSVAMSLSLLYGLSSFNDLSRGKGS